MPRPVPEAAPVTIATLPSSDRNWRARSSIIPNRIFISMQALSQEFVAEAVIPDAAFPRDLDERPDSRAERQLTLLVQAEARQIPTTRKATLNAPRRIVSERHNQWH